LERHEKGWNVANGCHNSTISPPKSGLDMSGVFQRFPKEKLMGLFMDILDPLGPFVDVALETSHERRDQTGHQDLYREHIDIPVLKSILWDYEDLLLDDGCTGIAVLNPGVPEEVHFDEHKLIIVYGARLGAYEAVMGKSSVPCDDGIKFIDEAEHVHSSSYRYRMQFDELITRLGIDEWTSASDY